METATAKIPQGRNAQPVGKLPAAEDPKTNVTRSVYDASKSRNGPDPTGALRRKRLIVEQNRLM